MIGLISRKGVPHQNQFCKEFHHQGALDCEEGAIRLRLIKCGSWARLFRLLRRSVWELWIKHLGHVAFFIRVHIWYALPFSWNYRLQDERGHDAGGMNHVGKDEIKKRISWQTSQGCVRSPEVPGVLFNLVLFSIIVFLVSDTPP